MSCRRQLAWHGGHTASIAARMHANACLAVLTCYQHDSSMRDIGRHMARATSRIPGPDSWSLVAGRTRPDSSPGFGVGSSTAPAASEGRGS